jgi:hypothetical protein
VKIDLLLKRLEQAQLELAKSALQQPQGRDAFDYGRAVGMYAGLEHAVNVLLDLVAEKDRKDFDL